MIGNGSGKTIINGSSTGDVVRITKDWVNITGFTITDSGSTSSDGGIKIYQSNYCKIHNCKFEDNKYGIYLEKASNNIIENNTCISQIGIGIRLYNPSNNNIINNNTCLNCISGIYVWGSTLYSLNNTIVNNTCNSNDVIGINIWRLLDSQIKNNNCSKNNDTGMWIEKCGNNTIANNICSFNDKRGIRLYNGTNNKVKNNTCTSNAWDGIFIYETSKNTIKNNKFNNNWNGILVSHQMNYNYNYNKINNNSCINNKADGIEIYKSSGNKIKNNTCINNDCGINISAWTSFNKVLNNTCNLNNISGIGIHTSSKNNLVENNTCISNNYAGTIVRSSTNNIFNNNTYLNNKFGLWLITSSHYNKITNNTSLNNSVGIYLERSNYNLIYNNTCNLSELGIYLYPTAKWNKIQNNTCDSNSKYGIFLHNYCEKNDIVNNSCSNNNFSLFIYNSPSNNLINNTCFNNDYFGIILCYSDSNLLVDNYCYNSDFGINIVDSDYNTILNNTIKDVIMGISINTYSNDCKIINTSIINASTCDIYLNGSSNAIALNCSFNWSNTLFKDAVSNLTIQWYLHVHVKNNTGVPIENANIIVKDNFTNQIYNGYSNLKGNNKWIVCSQYVENITGIIKTFSPYNISATKLPYEIGFAKPEVIMNSSKTVTIILNPDVNPPNPPTNLKFSAVGGKYINLSWNHSTSPDVAGYNIYINNTASNNTFHLIGYTNSTFLNVTNLIEETRYFFEIKVIDFVSLESVAITGNNTTLDITPPNNPTSLLITKIDGKYIEFSWAASTSNDVVGYQIFINNTGSSVQFHLLTSTIHTKFNHTGLQEETSYYYKVRAYDEVPLFSTFSNIVMATTYDISKPSPPTNINAVTSGNTITLSWTLSVDPDVEGYHIFMNNTGANNNGPFHWIHTSDSSTTQYLVTTLLEETTYYFVIIAFDEVPNNSSFSNVANATTLDITPPNAPTGLTTAVISGTKIKLNWDANIEPDISGYHIYMNKTNNGPSGDFILFHSIIGLETSFTISNLFEEVTYYFKIKAFDEVPNNSSFSNLVIATTPDETPPSAPTDLKIIHYSHKSITLTWQQNPEQDIIGYFVYSSFNPDTQFKIINSEPISITKFVDIDLVENTKYYYKITAIDDANLESNDSEVICGKTQYGPHAPEINATINDIEILEDSIDITSINLANWFRDVNNDVLRFSFDGNKNIDVTILVNGSVLLRPKSNWNGIEEITFFANDSIFETSIQVKIIVLPLNDPPTEPVIQLAEMIYYEGKYQPVIGNATDVDIPYGDELIFAWYSNVSGKIGTGQEINLSLSFGLHTIILNVTDKEGAWCEISIEIKIFKLIDDQLDSDNDNHPDKIDVFSNDPTEWNDTDGDNYGDNIDAYPNDPTKWKKEDKKEHDEKIEKDNAAVIGMIILIIILIIIFILLLFLFFKKEKKTNKNNE